MANRVLRDTTDSERVNKLSAPAEVFFYRLMMKADDHGCFHANNKLVRAALFPLRLDSIREADIDRWIAECVKSSLVVLYDVEDKPYLQILQFGQRLRSMKSKFPLPPTIVSNPPPETETETKLETKLETEITSSKTFFRIKDEIIPKSVSDYFKSNHSIFLENWTMKNKELIQVEVFEQLDSKYFGYSFNNENHVVNAFTSTWEKVKKKNPVNSQPSSKKNQL